MEDVGIDEVYLDISHSPLLSEEIAGMIKERIQKEVALTCSIGIASNKLIAKIASDMQKPDGLTIIKEDEIEGRIWPLPVRKLPGVGPKTEASLKAMGIHTIGELASLSLDKRGRFEINFMLHKWHYIPKTVISRKILNEIRNILE